MYIDPRSGEVVLNGPMTRGEKAQWVMTQSRRQEFEQLLKTYELLKTYDKSQKDSPWDGGPEMAKALSVMRLWIDAYECGAPMKRPAADRLQHS